jgi:hypothetical protein
MGFGLSNGEVMKSDLLMCLFRDVERDAYYGTRVEKELWSTGKKKKKLTMETFNDFRIEYLHQKYTKGDDQAKRNGRHNRKQRRNAFGEQKRGRYQSSNRASAPPAQESPTIVIDDDEPEVPLESFDKWHNVGNYKSQKDMNEYVKIIAEITTDCGGSLPTPVEQQKDRVTIQEGLHSYGIPLKIRQEAESFLENREAIKKDVGKKYRAIVKLLHTNKSSGRVMDEQMIQELSDLFSYLTTCKTAVAKYCHIAASRKEDREEEEKECCNLLEWARGKVEHRGGSVKFEDWERKKKKRSAAVERGANKKARTH